MIALRAWLAGRTSGARLRDSERGISMSELIIAMMLFTIVLAVVAGMYMSLTRASNLSRAIDGSTRTASNALNELAQVIRNGTAVPKANSVIPIPAFDLAGKESLTIYSLVDTAAPTMAPVKVSFTVNAKRQLIETRAVAKLVAGYWVWPGLTAPTTRNLSGSLVVPLDGISLFRYLDETGAVIPPDASGKLTTAQLERVMAVSITMRVEADAGAPGKIIELKNTVGVPNLGNVRSI